MTQLSTLVNIVRLLLWINTRSTFITYRRTWVYYAEAQSIHLWQYWRIIHIPIITKLALNTRHRISSDLPTFQIVLFVSRVYLSDLSTEWAWASVYVYLPTELITTTLFIPTNQTGPGANLYASRTTIINRVLSHWLIPNTPNIR
jgi:hypothetical protein